MIALSELGKEMSRLSRTAVRFDDNGIVLSQNGKQIRVSEDVESARLVIWAELADGAFPDRLAAAKASIIVNEREAFDRAATIGVPLATGGVIIGRSFEPKDVRGSSLLAEIVDFEEQMQVLETAFQAAYTRAADEKRANAPPTGDEGEHILRM